MDPNVSTHTLFEQGREHLEAGRADDALRCLRAAHERAPHHARIRSWFGLALARAARDFEGAVESCTSALKQEFFNPDLYYNAACVYLEFDFRADAVRCLRRGLMIAPSHPQTRSLLTELGERQGPVLRFLPRGHRLNVWLGHARHRVQQARSSA